MNSSDLALLNKMHETISAMAVVLNEVSSYNCHGREKMNKRWGELSVEMRKLNVPKPELTADLVRRLREHTGEGLMACKRALIATDCNFDAAVEHLRLSGTTSAR